MKIKVLHASTPLSWRGGERQLFLLCDQLRQKAVAQHVLCPIGSALGERLMALGENVHVHAKSKKRGSFDLSFARMVAKTCSKYEIDLVHVHDSHAHTAAILAAELFGNKTSIVVSRRVVFPVGASLLSRYKYRHKRVQAIICVSDAVRALVEKSLVQCEAMIRTVHSGVDPDRFDDISERNVREEFSIPEDRAIVINTAALEADKDYPTFLRTIKELKNRDVNVHGLILGKGSKRGGLEQMANELGISERVAFAGFQEDVLSCLRKSDVMLFPSLAEGLGTAVLDAFGLGIPVVATNVGGIPEMVIDGLTGALVEPGDDMAAADAVKRCIQDPVFVLKVIEAARWKLKEFSAQKMASETERVYRSIISKNH